MRESFFGSRIATLLFKRLNLVSALHFLFLPYCSLSGDSERLLTDLLSTPGFSSDVFSRPSDEIATEKVGDIVRIACFDIGTYRPQDMTCRVEGNHVLLQGKRTERISMGVEGAKFSKAIPIPEGVDPKRITTRYNSLDGQYIVEGVKMTSAQFKRKRFSSAYSEESKMTVSVDLGSTRVQERVFSRDGLGMNHFEGASRNSSIFKTTTDKIVI